MAEQMREIMDLMREGYTAEEVAFAIRVRQLNTQPLQQAQQLPLPTNGHAAPTNGRTPLEAAYTVIDDIVSEAALVAAKVGTVWRVPLSRLMAATSHSKYQKHPGFRPMEKCRDAVLHHFAHRHQKHMVSVTTEGEFLVITKVAP